MTLLAKCLCGHTPCDGLDCGPYLPGQAPRKRAAKQSPEELKRIRAKAWATRRAAMLSASQEQSTQEELSGGRVVARFDWELERAICRLQAGDSIESVAHNAALKIRAHIATLQREADGMREALGGISEHAENQDINHLDFRIHAKRCADEALEACSPQVEAEKGSDL